MPFEDAARRLAKHGLLIDFIPVSGRGGADSNAAGIAGALARPQSGPEGRLVLIGHSKGAVDILHFLVNHPRAAARVAAVVSVAGAVNGSPLADAFSGVYGRLFSGMPFTNCPPADREVVDSLRRGRQMGWLAAHPLPEGIAYFSLADFARRPDIHPLMWFGYDLLSAIDPRNDGYLLWSDQVIPGGALLGYAALDHYDVALPVRERFDIGGRGSRAADREIILQAILLSIAEALD
jgi:hypothetical protein